MIKKLLSITVKGLNAVTDVKFICGMLTGSGIMVIGMAKAVGWL